MIAIYIMASRSRTLYIGVTSDLRHRVWQHKNGTHPGFTSQYRITRLVYYEEFVLMQNAIAREKQLKRWSRSKKLWLIAMKNQVVVTFLALLEMTRLRMMRLYQVDPEGPLRVELNEGADAGVISGDENETTHG